MPKIVTHEDVNSFQAAKEDWQHGNNNRKASTKSLRSRGKDSSYNHRRKKKNTVEKAPWNSHETSVTQPSKDIKCFVSIES